MIINTKTNQINCIYAGGTNFSSKLEAFLESSDKRSLKIDICKTMPSDTHWHEMAIRLDTSLSAFIDENKIDAYDIDKDFNEESLVKILANNPKAMKGAILLNSQRISHITNYTELLEFYNVDSAGLEKTMHTESPTTTRQTDNDSFV